MALDAFINQKESYQQDLLDFARQLEVEIFVRSGKEFKLVSVDWIVISSSYSPHNARASYIHTSCYRSFGGNKTRG